MELKLTHVTLSVPSVPESILPQSAADARPTLPTIGHELSRVVRRLLPTKNTNANSTNNSDANATTTRPILRDVSGIFRPGSMTLVLGQPGSGKSSLLKLISSRLASHVTRTGEITYSGVAQSQLEGRVPQLVSYVPQHDVHFPTLTVAETITLAQACGQPTNQHQQDNNPTNHDSNKPTIAEPLLQQLGLVHCRDTIVGDEMLRGVSGGERKRVTLGEMDLRGRRAMCLDEISTGLDSAATLDIVRQYRAMAAAQQTVVVMVLLQPAPEVVALFDTVVLLQDGFVLYHGPRDQAVGYFASQGLECPPGRDAADFLLDVGTHQQTQYQVGDATTKKVSRHASEWAERFQQSDMYQVLLAQTEGDVDQQKLLDFQHELLAVPVFYQPWSANVRRLVQRELRVMLRHTTVVRARLATLVLASLLHATLFYQLDAANVQLVMGILFATVQFLALEQSAQIPAFHAARRVFYKHRDANLYPTSAYVVATALAQLPVMLVQVLVFGATVYWICGFTASVSHFLVFELLLLLANLAFSAWFFLLAAVTPNLHVAEPLNLLSLLLFMLFAGFMIVRGLIPAYFIWVYWLSPMTWALRSLMINQYSAHEFAVCTVGGADYCATYGVTSMGEYALASFQLQSRRTWLWLGVAVLAATYVLFMTLATLALDRIRFDDNDHGDIGDDETSSPVQLTTDDHAYCSVETPQSHHAVVSMSEEQAMDRRVPPVTLAFEHLWYAVRVVGDDGKTTERALLKGISGYAEPGTLTALMGSSGAGKTTLLDVIAGRKTGGCASQGQIFLNGHVATDTAIRRCTAYCEQTDVHAEAATLREALTFSALLRQDSAVSKRDKLVTVDECLALLELGGIADTLVRGATIEQRKRLTIGVALAAQPSVLFLDEPTSGLDARAAKLLMDGVRKVADARGVTVVCTIHQPSFQVFQLFDRLLLLQRGGETVYFGDLGPSASALVAYFQAIAGVAPIPSREYNPATWMLEVIGAGVVGANTDQSSMDFAACFQQSANKIQLESALQRDGLTTPSPHAAPLVFHGKRVATHATQARLLLQRSFRTYWRTPDYMLTRAVVYTMLALLFGLAFAGRDFATYQGANAGVALVYATNTFVGVIAFEAALPLASELRAAFYRERAAQTYNALWYFVASSVVEIPYVLVVTLLFCGIFFPLAGFVGVTRFVLYWLHLSLHVLLHTYLGELLAIVLPDLGTGMTVGVVVSTVFFNVMGFNPPASALPAAYKWLYEIVPTKFAFSIVGAILFGQCDNDAETDLACRALSGELPPAFPQGTTVQAYVARVFLISRDDINYNVAMMLAYIVGARMLTLLALRCVNHERK